MRSWALPNGERGPITARGIGGQDRLRIEQVIANLLTNARKYAPRSLVRIEASVVGDHAVLVVEDSGKGIALADLARVFDRFERVGEEGEGGGLGLGLFISRQVVEAHGGEIHVESGPGRGAKFVVKLPLREGEASS